MNSNTKYSNLFLLVYILISLLILGNEYIKIDIFSKKYKYFNNFY